ncbi:EVE domain-containing protein [Methanosalsum natronophilum]|uniref:EVE domain-containing protein n=1 Tax=Methanosalsum natronophilum TaxID=768733 RepID=UPI002167DEB9|nr:EVE domain-containing protein [Methanosalsum natronophilum]MCS3924435.1 SpoVK/Ycf46/Vps4 family AAA+-type ATPase [Methanosalsum natronophilum]
MEENDEIIKNLVNEYFNTFKDSSGYNQRKKQLQFCDFARDIIKLVADKEKIKNEDLTALIQILGHESKKENVKKYIDNIALDESISNKLYQKYIEIGETGFTGRGKAAIKGLNENELAVIHDFLIRVVNTSSEEEIRNAISYLEDNKISQLKYGIYSPWLYYLHPTICPIVAGPVKYYLTKYLGWNNNKYLDAWDIMKKIKQLTEEDDYGFIDQFFWKKSQNQVTNYWLFIVPKDYNDGKLWNYCKENSIAAMWYKKGIHAPGLVTKNLNQIKRIEAGDKVIVYINDNKIGGIGEVIREFYEDESENNGFEGQFGQRIGLKWISDKFEVSFKNVKPYLLQFPEVLMSQTIHELNEHDFNKIYKYVDEGIIEYDSQPVKEDKLSNDHNLLLKKKQIIYYGPPGTGKTYKTKSIAIQLIKDN